MKKKKKKKKNRQHLVKFYRGECLGSPHTGYGPARVLQMSKTRGPQAVNQIAFIFIVYAIKSAAYGVVFTSCLCENPNERGTSE